MDGGLSMLSQPQGRLLRQAFNSVGAEFRVLVTNLPEFNKLRAGPPSLNLFHAVPDLHDSALGGLPIDRGHLSCASSSGSSYRQLPTASCLDDGLSFLSVLLRVRLRVGHIDFRDIVDGRFGL